jgi:putative membrane protein
MWPMGGMMVGWLLLTVLAVGLVVWLAVSYARPRRDEDTGAARRTLAERYARGELDTDEYTQRVATLR